MYSGEGEIDPRTRIVGTGIEHCDDHRNPTVIDKAYPQALAHLIHQFALGYRTAYKRWSSSFAGTFLVFPYGIFFAKHPDSTRNIHA